MLGLWLLFLVVSMSTTGNWAQQSNIIWTWKCNDGRCQKVAYQNGDTPQGLEACKLVCDTYSVLWPRPTGTVELGSDVVALDFNTISVVGRADEERELSNEVEELVNEAGEIFQNQLINRLSQNQEAYGGNGLEVEMIIHDSSAHSLKTDSNESYELHVSQDSDGRIKTTIAAPSFFGARHALETLSQLIAYDDVTGRLVILREANITDSPVFSYRSIGLDTSRNYFSVAAIKRTIDGMAANKLNNFHWHITDSHSFPFQSQSYPQLTQYGAYSPRQIYTLNDIRSIVKYARARGVRVVPEFDAPAHVGEGWQWAGPNVTVCVNAQPWQNYCVEPPCGQLNPINDTVYEILGGIYRDMFALFDSDVFHMGGDEVNFDCWNSTQEIVTWLKQNGFGQTQDDFLQLWDKFQNKALTKVVEANGGKNIPVILWTSHLTEIGAVDKYLDNSTYIIQIWTTGTDKVIPELVNKGFRVIFSNYDALYFDCGFGGWVTDGNNWCSPYIGWQKVYNNSPYKLLQNLGVDVSPGSAARNLVLGAEAALWTEQVDDSSLDGRFWPRAAAMAERLWTNPDEGWQQAEYRMLVQRERLVKRGLNAEALEPQWCYQNEGFCPI